MFIAVECFQCGTMQVKQRKKSSNKWQCVICNEKQSLRKVFSEAPLAKHVRHFVQSFNMSRHLINQEDEKEDDDETLTPQPPTEKQQKRTDWSEYINNDDAAAAAVDDDDDDEPNVVTELPPPPSLFKKPKLTNTNYSAATPLSPLINKPGTLVKGNFQNNQHSYQTADHGSGHARSTSMITNFKSPNSDAVGGRRFTQDTGSSSVMVKLKRPASKWNDFIDDDDADADGLQSENRREDAFETKVSDEIVQDDVHPDFM